MTLPIVTFEDFQRVEMRVGRIVAAEPFPEARRPAYKLRIDFGPEIGVKQSSAQVTTLYSREELVGRLIVGVVNFPPRRVAGFNSEALVLGAADLEGAVVLLQLERDVPPGARIF
ncbi:MAG TPA: tRNA-binding protein [Ktedonobacterales bacterium]|jgi:tRNA-binding protein